MEELDPTHQRKFDIAHAELKANGGEAWGWILPCTEGYYGMPCDCQEMTCER